MAGLLNQRVFGCAPLRITNVCKCTAFTSLRPQRSSRCSAHAKDVSSTSLPAQPQQQQNFLHLVRLLVKAAPAAVPMYLLSYSPAVAEEDATVDAAFAAAAQSQGATDYLVTIMATLVFGLLLLVTGGVVYLNVKSWLDDRQEKDDKKAPATPAPSSASTGSSSDEDDDAPRRVRATRDKSRGFGKK